MKRIISVISVILILISIFFDSCSPSYIPNVVNTPVLSNKNELQANIGIGTSGVDPQLAYAVTNNVGVMLNGSFRNNNDSGSYHSHNFAEGGVGYYKPLSDAGRFEVFGGYGFGNVQAEFKDELFHTYANATMNKFFIQPAIGSATEIFDGSLATRISFVNIHIKDTLFNNQQPNAMDIYFEPVLTAKVGYKYVKFFMQIGFLIPLTDVKAYAYQPFIFAVGINIKINKSAKVNSQSLQ